MIRPALRRALVLGPLIAVACRASEPYRVRVPLGLDAFAAVPDDNPLSSGRVALGRRLFFDPTLSRDLGVSCSSCHRPEHALSDTTAVSLGAHGRVGRRNAPSLFNAAYRTAFFWDGRVTSLEEQVLRPIQDSLEMDLSLDTLVARLGARRGYRRAFAREFGEDPTPANVARALASYLRTLRSGDAPIDRYRSGDSAALSAMARRGFQLFGGKAGCTRCHIGPLFTDGDFHNTGIAWQHGAYGDLGRAIVTGLPDDRGRFKTPSLRDVALTPPYMHDGSKRSLEEVVEFYDGGGQPNPGLDPLIQPLRLTLEEKRTVVAFLQALTTRATRP